MIKRYKIKGYVSTFVDGHRMARYLPEVEGIEIISIHYNDWLTIKFIFKGTEEEVKKIIVDFNKKFNFYPKHIKEKKGFKIFNKDKDFKNEL